MECRVGGCKFSSLSRDLDMRYLVKEYSSELQTSLYEAIWRASTRRLPASCVRVSLHDSSPLSRPDVTVLGGCGAVEWWQPHPEACTVGLSLNRRGWPSKKRKGKQTRSAAVPLSHALSAADSCTSTGQTSSAVASGCSRSRFKLLTETQRYAITWSKQSGDDAKTLV